jgi:glucose/arabinose dehydrogenase
VIRRTFVALGIAVLSLSVLVTPVAARPTEPVLDPPKTTAALSRGQVDLQPILSGLSQPIGVVNAGDGTNRLFVVQQGGTVRVVSNHRLVAGNFLSIGANPDGLSTGGERGLLGLAFHPDFETNRKLFVNFTDRNGDTVVAELTANSAGTSVSMSTYDPILRIDQPYSNHNGGYLAFGPDGYLYVFTGDGGSAGDPQNRAQSLSSHLGKILRVAPTLTGTYSVPPGNPHVGGDTFDDIIWARGLRNPWRASFDTAPSIDQLWIADVGQGTWEEINRVPATSAGVNYGWARCEGTATFKGPGPCNSGGLTAPIAQYGHSGGNCSVTGGHVYRGSVWADLVGHYVLGDFCSGRLWTITSGGAALVLHRDTSASITSFGVGENGELYMTDYGGRLYRVVAPPFTDVASSPFLDEIVWIAREGITGGCGGGRFCPSTLVTREQMASFLARALNLPAATRDYFTDDEGSQHEADINRLARAGISGGCSAGRFCPTDTVTRAQMASFLVRALDLPPGTTDAFADDEGNIHEASINALARSGITGGCGPGRYCPSASVTREQMAAFLKRAFE